MWLAVHSQSFLAATSHACQMGASNFLWQHQYNPMWSNYVTHLCGYQWGNGPKEEAESSSCDLFSHSVKKGMAQRQQVGLLSPTPCLASEL